MVPPGTGIVHQVNIEHLARVVMTHDGTAYPDTCVGTDSHTTMQNGLGVLGWGVGGIEAEAAMLGQPISMLIPKVVGFGLTGELPDGATATDLVLTITEMLRRHGVVGKFPASDPVGDEPAGRPSNPVQVTLEDGTRTAVDHGSVVIAAITSCTNTSNPSVMVGAALLARNAVEAGLERKPWVKTTLAPGSKVVMDYYERAGLLPYLEKLGFNLVGYGCTTCIGNSGPLPEAISEAVADNDLAVVSVLSGNRNFEGRINPDVKMNYLASPPLVVAYALAGTMDIDLYADPIGVGSDGKLVYLREIWPSAQEIEQVIESAIASE